MFIRGSSDGLIVGFCVFISVFFFLLPFDLGHDTVYTIVYGTMAIRCDKYNKMNCINMLVNCCVGRAAYQVTQSRLTDAHQQLINNHYTDT